MKFLAEFPVKEKLTLVWIVSMLMIIGGWYMMYYFISVVRMLAQQDPFD